jgi:hypothetical protein
MEAPEQAYFMAKIMIDKVCEFPDDVSVDEPVPGEFRFEDGIFFKKADAKGYGCDGDEAGEEAIDDKDEERHAIVFDPESFVGNGPSDLYQQQEGNDRGNSCEDAVSGGQERVVAFLVHFQQGPQTQKAKQFVVECL